MTGKMTETAIEIPEGFISAINLEQGKGDRSSELILADWLEEQGDARGEAIRKTVAAGRLPQDRKAEHPGLWKIYPHRWAWLAHSGGHGKHAMLCRLKPTARGWSCSYCPTYAAAIIAHAEQLAKESR